ncbi:hypothetical protein [Asinibacterium sp. OR53]|uniref:hypothetical protein n=1 Tax=Asinibacterium sp. OR53 TaxID=925409 RepID=UPI00047A8AAB|nr:hypothetical protein [Asinibacterium sp. OR53]
MINSLKTLSVLIIAVVINSKTEAQNIDAALSTFRKNAPFEKAYVQFDNNRYAAGQTIWYKAYLLSGIEPSLISKNFYIDWYNDKGQLISSTVTPVIYSYSAGSYTLPEKYDGRFVHAICYTKWMRNFDSSYFYRQTFQIVSTASKEGKRDFEANETTVQFLPESGTLLSNKLNVIAFKAVNKSGLPETIDGIIKNGEGDSVASFKSVHDGMGKFSFVPNTGEKYTAEWIDLPGNMHSTHLPVVEENGVNLVVESGSGNRKFHVQRTKAVPDQMKQLMLVGQMNGTILFKANLDLSDKESITSSLPISKLLSGILQLTIFDANGQPLCERILFVKNDDYALNATIQVDTLSTTKRGKNVVEVDLKDTTYANLSLSVTAAGTNDVPDNTIISQLLLKGDLAGNIYQPAYYFASKADSVYGHLDLVMLTNGWRRYQWEEILKDPIPALKYPKDSGYLSIKGKIDGYAAKKGKKPEAINLILIAKDSTNTMLTLPILEDGSFASKNAMLFDTTKVYYKINGLKNLPDRDLMIENDLFKADPQVTQSVISYGFDTAGLGKFQYLAEEQRKLDSLKRRATLKEVTVHTKELTRIKQLDFKYARGIFSGDAAKAFDMSTLQNASHTESIFDFLTGKVPELEIGNNIGATATENVVEFRKGAVTFYLNETPIPASEVQRIDVSNVAYIKVFNPPFVGGLKDNQWQTASGGAIAIYTKKGVDNNSGTNNFETSGAAFKTLSGYTPVKEFYSPNYAEAEQAYAGLDLRSTLLWKPWISLDKHQQKLKIIFYNNDVTHSFRLVLEGMDSKGRLLHVNKLLK